MAFGRHWEWRGFATRDDGFGDAVRALPLLYERPQHVVDRYLWAPGATLNVKLRLGELKLKRLLMTTEDGLEDWLEDPAENFAFPLAPAVVADVARALGVPLSGGEPTQAIASEHVLLALLERDASGVRVIEIEKQRWQHEGPPGASAIVEYASILRPQAVVSVGVEDEDRERVLTTLRALGLPGALRTANYLDVLAIWGRGDSIVDG